VTNPEAEGAPRGDDTLSLAEERRLLALLAEVAALGEEAREERLAAAEPELARQVRARLAVVGGETPARSPDGSASGGGGAADDEPLETGTEIGPYRVLGSLGAGGMGHVYLAEQRQPIRRQVALKVLPASRLGAAARRRFSAERRAMARLDHPNVGKILDAGTTADGSPYLAMERIEGRRITGYCDEERLGLEERLRLFAQVCRGVDHAHRKFLLHRDIKPSNVLVTEIDGRPVPKLIDFGIAEMLDGPLPDAGEEGEPQVLGTPRYMSPEALGLGGDVDTRSDVFSLGVLLYELLTGDRPFEVDDGSLTRIVELRATTRPPRPSTRGVALDAAARRRGVRSGSDLARRLRGDLDAIVTKAIADDPEARYASAAELAADVERWLGHRPVTARPARRLYVLRRALRRHRGAAAAALVVAAALVLGTVGTTLGLLRAREAEEHARAEAAAAEDARAEAERVVEFLTGLFAASSPLASGTTRPPAEMTALELLERGAERVERELAGQPRVRARLERTIGGVYDQLGEYERARRHLDAALTLAEDLESPDPHFLAHLHLGRSTLALRLADGEAAGRHLQAALEAVADGEARDDVVIRADVFNHLGRLRRLEGDFAAAEKHLRRSIELNEGLGPSRAVDAAASRVNLGVSYFIQTRWQDAEAEFRQALDALQRELPAGHMRRLTVAQNLAAAVASQGRLEEAAPIYESTLAERRRLLGDHHPEVADSLNNLGALHADLGQPEKAAGYHRQALELREETLGADHPRTAWSLDNLARALDDLGRADEALPLQQRALAIREAKYGKSHPEIARSLSHLAALALERGDSAAALPLAERAAAIRREQLQADDPQHGADALLLGEVLWRLGRREEARSRLDEALTRFAAGGEATADDLVEARRRVAALGAG
jgi:tetratricopeptide (TPR) repeat protein